MESEEDSSVGQRLEEQQSWGQQSSNFEMPRDSSGQEMLQLISGSTDDIQVNQEFEKFKSMDNGKKERRKKKRNRESLSKG